MNVKHALAVLVFSLISIGSQFSLAQDKIDIHNIELPCDSEDNQSGMNQCSFKKYKIVDSIMQEKYNCIISSLETVQRSYVEQEDEHMTNHYADLLKALRSSQEKWLDMAKENARVYSTFYDGGSIRPLVVNLSMADDVADRIDNLDSFIATFNQSGNADDCIKLK